MNTSKAAKMFQDRQIATREELNAYFDNENICCLVCGREFAILPPHLKAAHLLSTEDYKAQFGIPRRYGLAGKRFRTASRKRMESLMAEGRLATKPSQETIERLLASRRPRTGPIPPLLKRENLEKVLKVHGRQEAWSEGSFGKIMQRIRSGEILRDISSDPDMPSRKSFMNFLSRNPSKKAEYDHMWEMLPFAQQVMANKAGDRYRRRIVELKNQGKSSRQIADAMGIRPSTVRNAWSLIQAKYPELITDLSNGGA